MGSSTGSHSRSTPFPAISDWRADERHLVLGSALAFAAGVFLCIALSDILPEVAFHSHDRFALSAALLVGVALAYGVGLLESEHMHSHSAPQTQHLEEH